LAKEEKESEQRTKREKRIEANIIKKEEEKEEAKK